MKFVSFMYEFEDDMDMMRDGFMTWNWELLTDIMNWTYMILRLFETCDW